MRPMRHPIRSRPAVVPRRGAGPAVLGSIATIALCLGGIAAPPRGADAAPHRLRGAPEIVFAGGGSADVVCIAIAVPVGSAVEPPGMRGACHFIEHLVFDGSERFSREEMSRWVDDTGSFLNAFTRKETTVYFLATPSHRFEEGLEILSQMLLHSVFPAAEIEKERLVILEEMRREFDDPRSSRERVVERALYRGSALAEPIIGYPASIEAIASTDLEEYYRRSYDPAALRVVLMGGCDPERAAALVGDYFGATGEGPRGGAPVGTTAAFNRRASSTAPDGPEPRILRWGNEIVERPLPGGASGIDMIVRLPAVPDRDFPAAAIVSKLIEGDDSPLARALAERSLPGADAHLEVARGFSALRIHAGCPDSLVSACRDLPAIVRALAGWRPDPGAVEKAKTALLSAEMLDREMYHFYIMSRGEAIALHGGRYLEQITDGVRRASAKDCAHVLEKYFREPRWNACLITAAAEGGPPGAPALEAPAATGRAEKAAAGAASAGGMPVIERLSGGGVAGAARRPNSPAAAIHLAFRGRSCAAGEGPPGLAELLVTVFERSSEGRSLARELETIGARVAFGDNPYVPQDDYILSPAFAFIRLESPAERIAEAARLLGDFLSDASVGDGALAEARAALMGETGMRSGSPLYTMRASMMSALFGSHPFAAPLFPPPSMADASLEDLRSLRARLFSRGNAVATIVSPLPEREAIETLAALVDRLPPGPAVECPPFPDAASAGLVEKKIRKEGAYLAAGWLVRSGSAAETAAAMAAGEILARRMQLELREKRGLAYTIDCGVSSLPGGAVVMAYLATGAERLEEARAALEEEIRGLTARPPGIAEIAAAKSRLLGKRSRSELASINSAYSLGLDIMLGGEAPIASLSSALSAAAREDILGIIGRALAWERAVELRLVPERRSP